MTRTKDAPDPNRATRSALAVLRFYRSGVSPYLRPACRFVPTCSEYAIEVMRKYGFMRGLAKAGWRLMRCHPLHPGGVDLPD
jgi:putative membrane protein insertion efficiency factor